MRSSRSEPTARSKRVTKAAPLRHRFSQDVSSSKLTPRLSRPRTLNGKRTEIRRSARCLDMGFDMGRLVVTMAEFLLCGGPAQRCGVSPLTGAALEIALNALQDLPRSARRM